MKRPVLLQKRAMRVISKSCYGAHTDPIFKNLRILPLNDMYLAEIGKIMFQYNTGSLPFKCMRFISFFFNVPFSFVLLFLKTFTVQLNYHYVYLKFVI